MNSLTHFMNCKTLILLYLVLINKSDSFSEVTYPHNRGHDGAVITHSPLTFEVSG